MQMQIKLNCRQHVSLTGYTQMIWTSKCQKATKFTTFYTSVIFCYHHLKININLFF